MPLQASIVKQSLLRETDRAGMLALHRRYFDNVRRDLFMRDMARKDWVIVLRDPSGAISGFSTVRFVSLRVDGEDCVFLFSGDTVVDEKHRQCGVLAGAFGHVMQYALDRFPESNCYWFLISKGYRTYRFLPLYFRSFFPCCSEPTPHRYDARLRAVGRCLFGDAYDAEAGIVRHAGLADRLAAGTCDIPPNRAMDDHVRFFTTRNPNYALGDELACIADVVPENFRRSSRRVIARTSVDWVDTSLSRRRETSPRLAGDGDEKRVRK